MSQRRFAFSRNTYAFCPVELRTCLFWQEKAVSVSWLEEERVLNIFMFPVYGEDTTVHKFDSNLEEK